MNTKELCICRTRPLSWLKVELRYLSTSSHSHQRRPRFPFLKPSARCWKNKPLLSSYIYVHISERCATTMVFLNVRGSIRMQKSCREVSFVIFVVKTKVDVCWCDVINKLFSTVRVCANRERGCKSFFLVDRFRN